MLLLWCKVSKSIILSLSYGGAGETGRSSISFSFLHSWHSDPGAVSLYTGFCYSLKLDGSRIYKWSLETPEFDCKLLSGNSGLQVEKSWSSIGGKKS